VCIDAYIARNKRNRLLARDAGVCRDCRKPAETGHRRCSVCAEKHRQYNLDRSEHLKLKGRCRSCGKPRHLYSSNFCLSCHLRKLCGDRLGNPQYARLMAARMDEQNGVCYLCRITPIAIGVNAELEHMYPISRTEFGADSQNPEYWRWACQPCNSRKSDLTAYEFWALYPARNPAIA